MTYCSKRCYNSSAIITIVALIAIIAMAYRSKSTPLSRGDLNIVHEHARLQTRPPRSWPGCSRLVHACN